MCYGIAMTRTPTMTGLCVLLYNVHTVNNNRRALHAADDAALAAEINARAAAIHASNAERRLALRRRALALRERLLRLRQSA
jgi:hypothetical protein